MTAANSPVTNEMILDRLMAMDQRFEAMEQRFEAIEKRLDTIDQRFEAMEQRFQVIERRLYRIEDRVDVIYDERKEVTIRFSNAWTLASFGMAVVASGISLLGYGMWMG